jgi:hypothetical protein
MPNLDLTTAECSHILYLIVVNERDEWHTGPGPQYWARSERIKEKIMAYVKGGKEGSAR